MQQIARKQLLLRYRFDRRDQAARHFHVHKGRALLFYPDPLLREPLGSAAMVELFFDDTEQTRVVTGEIAAAIKDAGLWIRSPDIDIGAACAAVLPPRRHRRLGANLFVEVRRGTNRLLASLHDMSLTGAQLGGGLILQKGENVTLRLLTPMQSVPTQLGNAKVVWGRGGRAGVEFDRGEPAVAKLYSSLQESWARAKIAHHHVLCCTQQGCIDPSLDGVKLLAG